MSTKKLPYVLHVVWEDAYSDVQTDKAVVPCVTHSIGFKHPSSDRRRLVLAQSHFFFSGFKDLLIIPRRSIVRVRRIVKRFDS